MERDREILGTLCNKVRILSARQLARAWWSSTASGLKQTKRRLQALESAGLVCSSSVSAHPELTLVAPHARWRPGQKEPDFRALSQKLRTRWKRPPVSTTVYFATKKSAFLVGGIAGRHPRPSECTHDLHLASIYLHYRGVDPDKTRHWIGEALIKSNAPQEEIPDALVDAPDAPRLAVEFGGSYRASRIERFHAYCEKRSLRYEIW